VGEEKFNFQFMDIKNELLNVVNQNQDLGWRGKYYFLTPEGVVSSKNFCRNVNQSYDKGVMDSIKNSVVISVLMVV